MKMKMRPRYRGNARPSPRNRIRIRNESQLYYFSLASLRCLNLIIFRRGRPRKRIEVSEPEESSEGEDSGDEQVVSPSKMQRNGRTGSHRVKEESPPAQNDDEPETPKREGLRTRAGGVRVCNIEQSLPRSVLLTDVQKPTKP
jgi:hypothetical protein